MSNQIEKETETLMGIARHEVLQKLGTELPKERIAWLAGYFSGQAEVNLKLAELFQNLGSNGELSNQIPIIGAPSKEKALSKHVENKLLTVLYGSHSGNGSGFAKQVKDTAETGGYQVKLTNMAEYKVRDLKNERNLLIIVSTHGEGIPPFAAEELYEFIHSERAPKLPELQYSILALGDKSYFHFCKTGIDFDKRLEELGAKRIHRRVDCDVNFKHDALNWLTDSIKAFDTLYSGVLPKDKHALSAEQTIAQSTAYDEEHPFEAEVIKKINLNGRGSEKETYHIELLLEESEIKYQPGDAVAVKASNSDEYVKKILEAAIFTGNEKVQTKRGRISLKEALKNDFELTILSSDAVRKHNEKARSEELSAIIDSQELFQGFIRENDLLDLLQKYPVEYHTHEFINILRPLSARLYSIASSQQTYQDELHITVGAVRYTSNGRTKEGCCSTFFADRIEEGDKVRIYVKKNEGFRLPDNTDAPIIMIGAGTGIAPYRAFVDERVSEGAKGKNWLIFGNQHFTTDFLYQTEWQAHLKSGTLTKMDVAFSRDQEEKVYVQHKILANSKEIYKWLADNAYIYVCGDKNHMAADVYNAILEVVQKEASISKEEALEFMKNLKRKGHYQEDVY